MILGAHMSIRSQRVILSRSFLSSIVEGRSAEIEIDKLRSYLSRSDLNLSALRHELNAVVNEIVCKKRRANF